MGGSMFIENSRVGGSRKREVVGRDRGAGRVSAANLGVLGWEGEGGG